jgi:hypothetical protein
MCIRRRGESFPYPENDPTLSTISGTYADFKASYRALPIADHPKPKQDLVAVSLAVDPEEVTTSGLSKLTHFLGPDSSLNPLIF